MEDLEVGCWDIFEDNAYEAAVKAGVLEMPLLEQLKEPLSAIKPMQAVFDQKFVKRINGPNVKTGGSKMDHAEMVMDDIRQFQERTGVSRTDHDLVRVHRGLPRGRAGPRHPEGFRVRAAEERSGDLAQPDLRLCRAEIGRAVRQRRAAPDHGYAGAAGTGARTQPAGVRQGLQERPDVHEDADRAGLEVAHAGA